jgi:uncharacterized MAPEG superfamily protein
MGPTATALVGFATWLVLLTFALAFYRVYVGATTGKALNTFLPDGSDTPGFGRRLTRARDNCFETLPVFASIALGAYISGRVGVTDGLAPWVLYSRIAQSVTHVISTSIPAVLVRATMLTVQIVIYFYWGLQLLR